VNVINGEASLKQALIRDKHTENLYVLPASQTRDKDALTPEGVGRIIDELRNDGFDFVVCDSPAGIERGAHMAMYFADDAVVVTNPEVSSVRDSDRILGLLQSKTQKAEQGGTVREHLLITRYSPTRVEAGEMLGMEDILEILAVPLIGVIPESQSVLQASNSGNPVILDKISDAGQAYDDFVRRFLGETVPHRFLEVEKKGFLKRLFG
jgi:septum site-determining protein MinD